MNATTRQAVHSLLKIFAESSLKTHDIEKLKLAYPFHRLIFDDAGLLAFKRERSVVTKMGQSLYPELARLIAREHYSEVARDKLIDGELEETTLNMVDRIVRDLRARKRVPNHEQELSEIGSVGNTLTKVPVRVIADLYIGDFSPGPLFVEIKTPKPNLDICAETKSKILTFETLLRGRNPRGYLAFAYNPYITRAEYDHGFTQRIMDMQAEVLMAEEFWDMIGGSGTFSELIGIIDEVGNQIQNSIK